MCCVHFFFSFFLLTALKVWHFIMLLSNSLLLCICSVDYLQDNISRNFRPFQHKSVIRDIIWRLHTSPFIKKKYDCSGMSPMFKAKTFLFKQIVVKIIIFFIIVLNYDLIITSSFNASMVVDSAFGKGTKHSDDTMLISYSALNKFIKVTPLVLSSIYRYLALQLVWFDMSLKVFEV